MVPFDFTRPWSFELCDTDFMAKRNLRVVKWLGTTPAVGVCTACSRTFNAMTASLKRTADAQESLRKQFAEHKCESLDSSQSASRIVSEAEKSK